MDNANLRTKRLPELDIMRGLAIFLVLGRHVLQVPSDLSVVITFPLRMWQRIGWAGVDCFFVLSGFLVSGLLFKEFKLTKRIDGLRFLIRRGFKIYPSYYLFLAVIGVASIYFDCWPKSSPMGLLEEGLFLQNYLDGLRLHTWSLAVEEHYYILIVGLLCVLARLRIRQAEPFRVMPGIVVACLCAILAWRVQVAVRFPVGYWLSTLPFTHFRVDSLLFGTLLSYLYHLHFSALQIFVKTYAPLLFLASILLLCPLFLYPLESSRLMYSWGFSFLYLGFGIGLLLLLLDESKTKQKVLAKLKLISLVGRHSYSIYLWHLPIYWWTISFFKLDLTHRAEFLVHLPLYLVGSLLVGYVLSVTVELPFLRLRDRLFPGAN